MGYYIISSEDTHGLLGSKGYFVVNPKSWNRLFDEARAAADYSALDALLSKKFNLSTISLRTARTTWLLTSQYPRGPIDFPAAKLKYSAELAHEKSIYDQLLDLLVDNDVRFEIRQEDFRHDRHSLISSLVSTFLARSSHVFEMSSGILRISEAASTLTRFFTTNNTGSTLAMIDIGDVHRIEVEPDRIDFKLTRKRQLSLGRSGCQVS